MGHGLKALVAAGLIALTPVQFASAGVITLEIAGSVDCAWGAAERGYCSSYDPVRYAQEMAAFLTDTGFDDSPYPWFGGEFTFRFNINMNGPTRTVVGGTVMLGNYTFEATASLREDGGTLPYPFNACSYRSYGYAIYIQAVNQVGTTPLCIEMPTSFPSFNWQAVAQLSEAGNLSVIRGEAEFDKYLRDDDGEWSAMWEARELNFIRQVPEPGTLVLLSLGIAGLGLRRLRKASCADGPGKTKEEK